MTKLFIKLVVGILLLGSSIANADIYDDAVANSARSDKDKEVDERRKPAEIMRFFEIQPGMKVFDVFAGGGYYSELISNVVGKEGSVIMYNNDPWQKFVAKAAEERLAGGRLANVNNIVATPESLIERTDKFDAAIFILGMHDIYYADPENGWPEIDKQKFLKGIHHILKDGAVFGVIDANAELSADNQVVGKDIHRVDPMVLIKDVLDAGFKLEATSDILSNRKDDKTTSVFLPENRYKTDRSVLRFRK